MGEQRLADDFDQEGGAPSRLVCVIERGSREIEQGMDKEWASATRSPQTTVFGRDQPRAERFASLPGARDLRLVRILTERWNRAGPSVSFQDHVVFRLSKL
jgi:hypothetical protein